jgi:predicted small secreted protein
MTRDLKDRTGSAHKVLLAFTLALFSASALAACNTMEGAGKDIESTGEAIQDSADGDN